MNITSIVKIPCVEITTDEDGYNTYRRFGEDHWEGKMRGIWIRLVAYGELEDSYQKELKE